jgi:hypothetical protein
MLDSGYEILDFGFLILDDSETDDATRRVNKLLGG